MKSGTKILIVALLLVALVLVNFLASRIPVRADLTAGNIYTLSPGTRSLLSKLEEPMTIDFYFTRSATGVPISFKNFGERVEEMLRQYARASNGRVTLNVIDPQPDTPEEEKAATTGIQSTALPSGIRFYAGVVATMAEQRKIIPVLTTQREQFLEYDLSRLVYETQLVEKKRLGLISSLPLRAAPNPMMRGPQEQTHETVAEWERTFEIVPIDPATATSLPENLDLVAVIHPLQLSPSLQYAIDQFILSGKPALIAVDPSSVRYRSAGGEINPMGGLGPNVSSDLPVLLNAYGVFFDTRQVTGDLATTIAMRNPQTGLGEKNPVFIAVAPSNLNTAAQPTAQLSDSLWFIEPGSLEPQSAAGTTFTPLVRTSAQAGEIEGASLQLADAAQITRQLSRSGQRTLAAMVTGRFKTAFPDGPPPAEPPPPGMPAAPAADPAAALKVSTAESTIIVVADTDWLLDPFTVQRRNFLGSSTIVTMNDNLSFAANVIDFLGASADLISLRSKEPSFRRFTVVEAMEADANQRYNARLSEVSDQLEALQQKLSQLTSQKVTAGRLTLSAEEEATIDSYNEQRVALSRERREIRRLLRQDIDALENRTLAINLLAAPVLVCAFGLLYNRRRRR